MRKVEVRIELEIKFYDTFFFGGGTGQGNIQSYLMRDVQGYPYISGAALKGCIREYANALAEFYPASVKKEKLFGIGGNQQGCLYLENGRLVNHEMYEGMQEHTTELRTSVSINRYTRAKREGQLYTMEISGQGGNMVFGSNIQGFLDEDTYKEEIAYLVSAIKMIFALGGRKSAGLGWLEKPINCIVYIEGEKISSEEIDNWIGGEL